MNKTKFMQTDSRWGGLGYPKKPWYIRNCGCGEVSIANCIIEMEQYKNYTPATIQPYCKQYAAPNGDGTYWSGIPKMMSHYGLTEVKEHATMSTLWTELAKGGRVAIYLMGSRKGGSKGVHWTSGGHFVCSVDYKYQNGKHYVYVKDSYSNSSLRNGFISYEENMRNDVLKVWSGKLNSKKPSAPSTTPSSGKLAVDGIGGIATVQRLQEFLGLSKTDGITIRKDLQKYVPALKAYEYGNGSPTVKAMQKWLGLSDPDGLWGRNTSKALQLKVGFKASECDGIFGPNSMAALQRYLNEHDKAVYPAPKPKTLYQKEMEACQAQSVWMKNATYSWPKWKPKTVAQSKIAGTCVTYVACVLQRLGYLKAGQYIWHNGKGYGTGKVYGTNSKMVTAYMGNKTLSALKGQLKGGDIVMVDDNKSGQEGSGGHIFILTGSWTNGDPWIWDNETAKKGQKPRKYSGKRKVLAIVRLK